MADGGNQGPFGEKNFFIPNLHWPYGLSRPGTTGSCLAAAEQLGHHVLPTCDTLAGPDGSP
jgi:hypothetical protein